MYEDRLIDMVIFETKLLKMMIERDESLYEIKELISDLLTHEKRLKDWVEYKKD